MTTIVIGEREARHYVDLIERVQKQLKAKRFYSGAITGKYSPDTVRAMKRFQQVHRLSMPQVFPIS